MKFNPVIAFIHLLIQLFAKAIFAFAVSFEKLI
jgi:hypothetical protein